MEQWRPVIGFDGYEVSDLGRVRSLNRTIPDRNGRLVRYRGRVLRPGVSETGHLTVVLGRGNTKQVHALVLFAFVGPCPDGYEGLHTNDDPSNNRIENLSWGTRSINLFDAVRNGKKDTGEDVYNSKLTEDAVRYIRAHPEFTLNSLGKYFGVAAQTIKQVRTGRSWKGVT